VEVPPVPPLTGTAGKPELLITPRPGATQGHLQLACRLPGTAPEAAARYALMAEVMEVRMWRRLREQLGGTYGFNTQVSMARGGAAHLLVEGVVDAPQLGASLLEVHGALTAYARQGVPAAEFERARARLLARDAVALNTSRSWVNALLRARVLGWDAEIVTGWSALLQTVTAADLQKEFATCAERLVVGITGDKTVAQAAAQAAFATPPSGG
jgi:zinc protease